MLLRCPGGSARFASPIPHASLSFDGVLGIVAAAGEVRRRMRHELDSGDNGSAVQQGARAIRCLPSITRATGSGILLVSWRSGVVSMAIVLAVEVGCRAAGAGP